MWDVVSAAPLTAAPRVQAVEPVHAPHADSAAVADELRRLVPIVYRYLYNRLRSKALAEDLTQETVMAAVAAVRAGRADRVAPEWLIGVARHKLADHFRRRAREEQLLARHGVRSDEDACWQIQETRDRAAEALLALRPLERAALVLRHMDDLPVPEVAALLGRSVHATESLLVRARAAFRRAFEEVT